MTYLVHIRTEIIWIRHCRGLVEFLQRRNRRRRIIRGPRAEANFSISIVIHETYEICSESDIAFR